MIALLQQDPGAFLLAFTALAFSLALHEWGHAYAAFRFGDGTAKAQGRLTLNPLRHLDPLGTLLLLLVGFGWAKPVPVNPSAFRAYRLGLFAVSVAGILLNLALAVLLALLVRGLLALDPLGVALTFGGEGKTPLGLLALAAFYASSVNLVLAVFNLLPIPPLDGAKILQSLLPLRWHPWLWRLEGYSWLSFLLLLTVLRGPVQEVLGFARRVFFGFFFG
ncbi:Membrane metalloprotease [Thermus sp. CCB_US3_UF1]|uniref:site-2 protease family protein n=1 Tax=Thermus sp. CCB_US3_UF1 TaxID=1111069 RepID=UPI00023892C4|nr:site-2 protease family protein [Thermus sp. CCB_US3_UF1]AEV16573.1 Membrane metalloprotease [Thermus sp. CCB_US3_UF1]